MDQRIFLLKGKMQHYSWGGYDFLPQLLGLENDEQKPFAEYWLGAHPNHLTTIENDGQQISLHDFISQNKTYILGETVAKQFGALPYLFKVLDVRQMLSIQVHPNKKSAEAGFEKENAAGIPVNVPHRNYKDDNHKPELMIALNDFWLLHGFKPEEELKKILSSNPEFNFLLNIFGDGDYKSLYEKVMLMEQQQVNNILQPLVSRILPLYKNGSLKKDQEDFWAARAAETFRKNNNYDRGIFSIYFFNLVQLQKGEGIYQRARLPHAYLEGQNVEAMANSDNVLRAGLTDKHIDVKELIKNVKFDATQPKVIGSSSVQDEVTYSSSAEEFEVDYYNISTGETAEYSQSFGDIVTKRVTLSTEVREFETSSAEIILVLNGQAKLSSEFHELTLHKGNAALIIADTYYTLWVSSHLELFRVSVPAKGIYS
ncbi:MAG: mannose-6-phosphate isomerase, class I [Chitinophagaceae bacterium]